jgi:magnesium transporter
MAERDSSEHRETQERPADEHEAGAVERAPGTDRPANPATNAQASHESAVSTGDAASDASQGSADIQPFDDLVAQLNTGRIDVGHFAAAVQQQDAPDAADVLEDLQNDEEAAEVLVEMDAKAAADAIAEMEMPLAVRVIEDLVDEDNAAYAGQLIQLMAPDDAVDLLQELEESHRENLLKGMPYLQAAKLRRLIRYDRESAGGIMTTDYMAVQENASISQAIEAVRRQMVPDELQQVLVINRQGVLRGALSLGSLLLHLPGERVSEVMKPIDPTADALRPEMDREQVANEFARYDYTMMPVVDAAGRLIGVVTVDDVIDIIQREQTEDVQRTVGAGAGEAVYSSVREKLRGRFPWLVVNLFTSMLAALVVLNFEGLIAELAILAVLMPIIANQAGNAGQQALAVTLRGIVMDEVRAGRIMPLLMREAGVGAINGLMAGSIIGGMLTLLGMLNVSDASWELGIVAAISMSIALAVGCFAGASMPLLMRRYGFDPAHGSSIFLTMITDSMSFFTFLGCAGALWRWLH